MASESDANADTDGDAAASPTTGHPDAPFVAADPDVWHPIRCARVRDADDVETVEGIDDLTLCPWCRLFFDPTEEATATETDAEQSQQSQEEL